MVNKRGLLAILTGMALSAFFLAGCGKTVDQQPSAGQMQTTVEMPSQSAANSQVPAREGEPGQPGQTGSQTPGVARSVKPTTVTSKAPTAPGPAPAKPKPVPNSQAASPVQTSRAATSRPQVASATAKPAKPSESAPAGIVLTGTVVLASHVPEASEVPYTTCVTFVKYRVEKVESGDYSAPELIAVFWGMRDSKLQPAARFGPGQRQRLTLQPLSKHPELARMMQADDTNEYTLTPYWVVSYEGL